MASLSALGAGALATTAANAGPVSFDSGVLTSGNVVGFSSGSLHKFDITGPNGLDIRISTFACGNCVAGYLHSIGILGLGGGVQFLAKQGSSHPFPRVFGPGKAWKSNVKNSPTQFSVESISVNTKRLMFGGLSQPGATFRHFGLANFSNQFALFRWADPAHNYDYGWIKLSYSAVTDGLHPGTGPDVTISEFGYTTSGAQVAPGVPEPSAFELSGLAALALGAIGVRRWRAARAA